jgi:hypothetical protein
MEDIRFQDRRDHGINVNGLEKINGKLLVEFQIVRVTAYRVKR